MKLPQPSAIGPHSSGSHVDSVRQTTLPASGGGTNQMSSPDPASPCPSLPPLLPLPLALPLPTLLAPALLPSPPRPASTPGGLLPQAKITALRLITLHTHTLERTESSFSSTKHYG